MEHFYFEAFSWLEKGINKECSFLFKILINFECANLQFFFNKQILSLLFFSLFRKAFFISDYSGNYYICGLFSNHVKNMINEVIKKNGITFGIIIGVVACLSQTLVYTGGSAIYKSTLFGTLVWLLYWVIRIFQAITTKKQLGNIINFKDAFTTLLISTSIGILISITFNYVLYNFIAPEFKPELNNFMNSKQVEIFKAVGKSSSEVNELLKNDNFSIANLIKGGLFSIVISSIFNLILSAFIKPKPVQQ